MSNWSAPTLNTQPSIIATGMTSLHLAALRWLCMVAVLCVAGWSMAAQANVKVVRIASIGALENGKVVVTSQSARVQQEGWLEQQLKTRGIRLEWYPVATSLGGPGFNEALASRTVDFASYGDLPSIIARSAGVDIKLIVPYGGATNSYLVVGKNVPARSLQELKGKRIAFHRGRPAELALTRLLEESGMKLQDFKIFNLAAQAGAAALVAGNVDAYFGASDAYLLQDQGHGRIIWSTKDAPEDSVSWNTRVDLYARKAFLDEQPELSELVARAYIRAAHWVSSKDNYDEVVNIYARPGIPTDVVRRDFEDQKVDWRAHWAPLFDSNLHAYFQGAVRLSLERRLIRRDFDVNDLFDTRFAQQALRNLQLEDYWTPRKVTTQVASAGAPGRIAQARAGDERN